MTKTTISFIRAYNVAFETMELALQHVIEHADSKGYTVEFEQLNRYVHCRYVDANGNDVFEIDNDYSCSIDTVEYFTN